MISIEFRNPEFLWLLLLLPVLAFLKGRAGKSGAILFSSIALAKHIGRKNKTFLGFFIFLMRLVSLGLLIIALGRPQLGKKSSEIESSGIDMVLAVDVSSSMLALDFTEKPTQLITRLDVAKTVLRSFIEKRPNDRIGLIAFAKEPYLVSPITLNHSWLQQNLERLQIGMIEDGTAIGSAIGMSVNRLRDIPAKSRIIILLTDGVNNTGQISPTIAAEAASSYKVKIYTIGIGNNGRVPTLYLDDNKQVAKNVWGQVNIAHTTYSIDLETLRKIAETTEGNCYKATDKKQLEGIYREIDALEKTEVKLKQYSSYEELFHWVALAALMILLIEQFFTRTRRLP